MAESCEILIGKVNRRGHAILAAMAGSARSCGIEPVVTGVYQGKCHWLMSYGLGHMQRKEWTSSHIENGGRLIGWDLGYWDRDTAMRLTIDAEHPYRLIKPMPGDRFAASGIKLRNTYNPDGHILIIGMGVKSRVSLGFNGQEWELQALDRMRKAFPERKILYRAKKPEPFPCEQSTGTIEQALNGCSMAVCRHSNVAIDACIAGVPVLCTEGAARALYGNGAGFIIRPSEQERLQFLSSLAYWQYRPSESIQAWKFIKEVLNAS